MLHAVERRLFERYVLYKKVIKVLRGVNDRASVVNDRAFASEKDKRLGSDKKSNKLKTKKRVITIQLIMLNKSQYAFTLF